MLTPKDIERIFAEAQAIITGDHFVYAKKEDGWYHGSDYVNKDAVFPDTDNLQALCEEIASRFTEDRPAVIVGPTVGGALIAQWVAHAIGGPHDQVFAVFADEEDVIEGGIKIGTRRIIKRGYNRYVDGATCLLVEDVINSGATVIKTRDAIVAAGGTVIGVGALCNRSGGKVTAETLGVPRLSSLLDVYMDMYPEDECPICMDKGRGSVRTDLGKGKEFLARIGIQPGDM